VSKRIIEDAADSVARSRSAFITTFISSEPSNPFPPSRDTFRETPSVKVAAVSQRHSGGGRDDRPYHETPGPSALRTPILRSSHQSLASELRYMKTHAWIKITTTIRSRPRMVNPSYSQLSQPSTDRIPSPTCVYKSITNIPTLLTTPPPATSNRVPA